MFSKTLIDKLINTDIYIYIRNIDREFSGILQEITSENIIILKDKYNNLIHIPLDLVDVITERQ